MSWPVVCTDLKFICLILFKFFSWFSLFFIMLIAHLIIFIWNMLCKEKVWINKVHSSFRVNAMSLCPQYLGYNCKDWWLSNQYRIFDKTRIKKETNILCKLYKGMYLGSRIIEDVIIKVMFYFFYQKKEEQNICNVYHGEY